MTMTTESVHLFIALLIVFHLKHFLADFVFQNVFMLQKSRPGWDFVLPLATHCAIHGVTTLAVVLWVMPGAWWLAVFDFVTHFLMDRIKAGPKYLGRYQDVRSKVFWTCFGLDQMVHHLTHLFIAWYITIR